MTGQTIAVIPGDGIGTAVISSARAVLDAVADRHAIELSYTAFDWSCERYVAEGAMMPDD
ncbi:tartrate dehydrogenase, partial [Mycobacterium sp. ITM-2017-0098]